MTVATTASRAALAARVAAASTVAALAITSCAGTDGGGDGDGDGVDTTDDTLVVGGVAVLDAWVRPTPPGSDAAAIYVTVGNETDDDSAILGASSSRCTIVVPHTTTIDDGVASMDEALDADLALPSGGRVTMQPNGLHLMCLGLDDPLLEGERIDVTLDLADRSPVDITVVVEQR